MISKNRNKKVSKAFNKIVVGLVISLLITLPATAISINMKTNSSNTFGDPPIFMLGDTIIVDDDGTGDYTSIQDAINNAAPGDYIIVKDGTYAEQLTVNVNALTISAASGELPTIYVSSYSIGIDITASDVIFENFEIYGNGSLTGGPYPTFRASAGSDGLIITGNHLKVFTGEYGQMGLYVANGVKNVQFNDNTLENYRYSVFHAAFIDSLPGPQSYYGTIQDALDDAEVGDTVITSDGTYTEQIIVNKSVTLTSTSGDYRTSNVIIDASSIAGEAIRIEAGAGGASIEGLEITNSNGGGIIVYDDAGDNVKIQSNYIHDLGGSGIPGSAFTMDVVGGVCQVWPPLENWEISDNKIINVIGSSSSAMRPENMKDVTISSNIISNVAYSGILLINIDGGTVSNNVVTNISRAGIQIDSYCTREINIINNVITQANTGSNSGYGGIRFYGQYTPDPSGDPPAEITVTGNTCNDSYNGLAVKDGQDISGRNITAQSNSLINNSNMGVYHGGTGILDATNNWWGDISGPYHPTDNPTGMGVNVSDNVTFWPWYEFDGYSIFPTVTYTVGQPNAFFGEIITDDTQIEITAEDDESGLLSLEYRVWDASSRWSEWQEYTEKFRLSGDGQKLVEYNATDNAGTQFIAYEAHRVDTTPPYVEVIYPNGGEFLRNNVEIQWEAADKIPDQEQTVWNGYWSLTEEYPGHIQSFQPTESSLNSIGLLLVGEDADVSVKIYSNITPVPIQIAQSTQHLQYIGNENNPVWIDFPLDTGLNLDTDITYYIGVTQEIHGNEGLDWYYFDSTIEPDPYLYGNAWLRQTDQLEEHLDWDFGFRTMYWEEDVQISVQYSSTGVSPWSTLAEQENNDGSYIWDTSGYPDGNNYRVRIIAEDDINTLGADFSDNTFQIDNTGPIVSNVVITDTTLENTEYTKDGDSLEITATVEGNPIEITADLSGFGKGEAVPPTSFTGITAKWLVDTILCTPSDGEIEVIIQAEDPTGDISGNTGSIIADNTPPSIEITRPGPGVYIMDSMRLLPFSYPLIIGQITFRAEATDSGSGVNQVDFVIDDSPCANISEVPYEFLWDEAAFGFFTIEVIATDNVGHTETDIMRDFFIINFDII